MFFMVFCFIGHLNVSEDVISDRACFLALPGIDYISMELTVTPLLHLHQV